MAAQRLQCAEFEAELAAIRPSDVADIVDHRLLRSAMARVTWELDIANFWHQPRFYTDQALGPIFDVLLPPDVDAARIDEVIRLLGNVQAVVDVARDVLPGRAVAEFTALASTELVGVDARLESLAGALSEIDPSARESLLEVSAAAAAALGGYRDWLVELQPTLPPASPIGPAKYHWFLREVACVPLSTKRIRELARQELDRAIVLEMLTRRRYRSIERPALPVDGAEQARHEKDQELEVREFYAAGLLSQPDSLAHYLTAPMPKYLEPLRFLGVADDLTSPERLDHDGYSYFPEPGPGLPYFYAANAVDPRAGIVHEGAHYQQLALAWRHPRPIRRHYYDSGANEGIAFYNEELMLASGLFDDAPYSQVIMYNFMRLRALRVELDVGLATGDLSMQQAADLLEHTVPIDAATAAEEAAFFAETPGQALTYQIGKSQLLALIADAQRTWGGDLDLQALHDSIWLNGNVPIALQRWELLGLTDELDAIGVVP